MVASEGVVASHLVQNPSVHFVTIYRKVWRRKLGGRLDDTRCQSKVNGERGNDAIDVQADRCGCNSVLHLDLRFLRSPGAFFTIQLRQMLSSKLMEKYVSRHVLYM